MMGWKLALGLFIVLIGAIALADYQTTEKNKAMIELKASQKANATHKRIQNADTSGGDDTNWLCRRSGRGNCGP